jgi:DNA-binding HxlR family transcriptional regulator
VLKREYQGQDCSIARTLELVGERWTLLIIRDVFRGYRRFDEFQRRLGIASNVLAKRLDRLVEAGIFERIPYQERPVRHEYVLTERGRELGVPLFGLMHWGDKHLAPDGPPMILEHDCGATVTTELVCAKCGTLRSSDVVHGVPGPGRQSAIQVA